MPCPVHSSQGVYTKTCTAMGVRFSWSRTNSQASQCSPQLSGLDLNNPHSEGFQQRGKTCMRGPHFLPLDCRGSLETEVVLAVFVEVATSTPAVLNSCLTEASSFTSVVSHSLLLGYKTSEPNKGHKCPAKFYYLPTPHPSFSHVPRTHVDQLSQSC